MNITSVTTTKARHIPGIGTLPTTVTIGDPKWPKDSVKLLKVAEGVVISIRGKSILVPWVQIDQAGCTLSEKNS